MGTARAPPPKSTPDDYAQHRRRLITHGVRKRHAPGTRNNIEQLKEKWRRHCKELQKGNPLHFLQAATKEDIMIFMKWILDVYLRVRKQSTLLQYFRQFRMVRRKCLGSNMHAQSMEDINDYIKGYLTTTYQLDLSMREKMVMNVDDIYNTLHWHWTVDTSAFPDGRQRLQLALLILVLAYTASRPGALVYVERNIKAMKSIPLDSEESEDEDASPIEPEEIGEAIKTLCYEDVTLVLLPNPGGIRDVLAMEVNLQYTKGHESKPRRKIFLFSEVNDFIFDATLPMISAAVDDNAFESQKIQSIEDIYRIRVKPPRHSLELKWKKSILKTPIFRQAVPTATGIRTSPPENPKALRYYTALYQLQRLGISVGSPQLMTHYYLRRGGGEGVLLNASQGILQQVMNHRDAGVFQSYINERVQFDVQAAFLGRPSADAALKATGHISRYIDPRAPSKPTVSQQEMIRTHPSVVKCKLLRDALSVEARRVFGAVKNAVGSEIYRLYTEASAALQAVKVKLRKSTIQESRNNFFDTIHTKEIDKQLDLSLQDLKEGEWEPQTTNLQTLERKLVAQLICTSSPTTEETALRSRIATVKALVALCKVPETRSQPNQILHHSSSSPTDTTTIAPKPTIPKTYTSTQCPLCLEKFCRPRKMRAHAKKVHLALLDDDSLIACPNPTCGKLVLCGTQLFKRHAALIHKSFL